VRGGVFGYICSHCGKEAYRPVLTQQDIIVGAPYFAHGTGQVVRAARERSQLFDRGLYKTDLLRKTTDVWDAYIPIRKPN
jgi:hypothetical protein